MPGFTYLDPSLRAAQARFEVLLEHLRDAQVTEVLIHQLEGCVYDWIKAACFSSGRLIANDLTLAVSVLDLLQGESSLPADLRELTETACHRLLQAAGQLRTPSPLSSH